MPSYDLSDVTYENADAASRLEPGWYRAQVVDATPDEHGTIDFEFEVTHPPQWAHARIKDKLFDPANSIEERKRVISTKRVALFGKRLGVIPRDGYGQTGVEIDWSQSIGQEIVIKVERRKYTDKEGVEKEASNLAFDGVYNLDDAKVPEDVRLVDPFSKSPTATTATTTKAPPKAKQKPLDFDSI